MKHRRTISSDTMQGTPVKNHKDEDLGKVEEVMVDMSEGKVAYLVLSYGGIFGTTLADKRFAVPFSAITIQDTDNDNDVVYRLNVNKETLENAPGFNKDQYPDFADPSFTTKINSYYSNLPRAA